MTLTTILRYSDQNNYSFDANKVAFPGNLARLKLVFESIADLSEDFADDTGFTYDSTKAAFSGGALQQVDQTPANSLRAARFESTANLDWTKEGSITGTLRGGATVTGGKLVCAGSDGVFWTGPKYASETHKFLYTPNYNTSPPTNVNLYSNQDAGGSNNDRFALTHSPAGDTLRITLNNSAGASIFTATAIGPAWQPNAGQEYEIEVTISAGNGRIRVFIDGTLWGTLNPANWTRGTGNTNFYLGASPAIYDVAQGSFDNYIAFDNIQHMNTYVSGYTIVPFIYAASSATLPSFTYSGPGQLRLAGTFTTTQSGQPRFILQDLYWDGSAWVSSDGSYAQASSKTDVQNNLSSYPSTGVDQVVIKVVFTDTNTQGTISQLTASAEGEFYPQDNPTVINGGFLADDLIDFVENVSKSGNDDIRWTLKLGATDWWYNTGTGQWEAADASYAQTNSATEIKTNLSTLPNFTAIEDGKSVSPRAFLHSDDGTTTPELNELSIEYSFFVVEPEFPDPCIIYGFIDDIAGNHLSNSGASEVKLRITNYRHFDSNGHFFPPNVQELLPDAEGYVEKSLVETQSVGVKHQFDVVYTTITGERVIYPLGEAEIPNKISENIVNLTFT